MYTYTYMKQTLVKMRTLKISMTINERNTKNNSGRSSTELVSICTLDIGL